MSSNVSQQLKQIDYLKLAATGSKSSYYSRPSEADEALKGLIGYGMMFAQILIFVLAVCVSLLGAVLSVGEVGVSFMVPFLLGVPLLIVSIFLGGAPTVARIAIALYCGVFTLILLLMVISYGAGAWYLSLPTFAYAMLVLTGTFRQLLL